MDLLPLPAPGATPICVMTIAGSDSGGAAGLQSDLRTFALAGVHGTCAVTAVTVQNSLGVTGFHPVPPPTVAAQIRAVASDIGVSAAKTGMLADAGIIAAVADTASDIGLGQRIPFLVDPVSASHHGEPLLTPEAFELLVGRLFPLATIVTPNLDEVRLLTGIDVVDDATQRDAARALHATGPRWVLVKGGHLRTAVTSTDLLYDGSDFVEFEAQRIETQHDHGAGDTLGAAVTCALAEGMSVPDAVAFGKEWVTRSLAAAYPLGAGHGPVSASWRLREQPPA
ncbi:bifunctional hydroxymethylpyrimidine kinase/phosphomethylpyrimidine kinase [Tsukamurella sp. 8F]|uniref:bifunctional hydroxymethylpyrimidine kinase/phosphomethylpyrimidine kinase n=1 Tax=unclassified Tsukamurella TaxID=2633480 RepID=UPI0023B9BDD7|nr:MULTISPECIES: bifunctional hydroxymethylpyrimidine kinase/phosphomethylpyrimidine kinase [unclassified Tsukamurella]MDF0529516.1 bifunctional hydroxymethylpyrimidine kinase/phosphomethylpyrimidine kinase [Tsukamurella sp. 8J]MDF0585796.1 bifunctional hydroxymethylpyrimidine kinase/phosphomethylpyrimidine kinase [Tsukamurella sp. 8F]